MALNPNYPVIEESWGPSWGANGASLPSGRWVNMIDRTVSAASARRGKQYELDQPQAGEYSVTLGSQDGALDPTNTSGPYASHILPLQPYKRRAMWPPSANVLDKAIATGGESYTSGAIPASFGLGWYTPGVTATIATPTAGYAWQGSNVFSFALPSNISAQSGIFAYENLSVRPGKTVTLSLYIANTTASTTAPVTLWLRWYGADGSVTWANGSSATLTGASGSPTWQRITVTATAPTTGAYTYGMRFGLDVGGTAPSGACTLYVDGIQLEWASTASAWVSPGTWYPIFSGFTERWPTQWADGGTYGQVSPTAVDSFALLSQVQLRDILLEEIDSRNPRYCFPLSDPAGSTSFADMTGNFRPVPVAYSKAGTGGWTAGNSITSSSAGGAYTGSTGTVVNASPSNPGSDTFGSATVLDLPSVGITGPVATTWSRMIAFRYTDSNLPTGESTIWEARDASNTSFGGMIRLYIEGTAGRLVLMAKANGTDPALSRKFLTSGSVCDGNWHFVVFGYDNGNNLQRYSLDGVASTSTAGGSFPPLNEPYDYVGASYFRGSRTANRVFKGDLAFVGEFSSFLSEADMNALYTAWKTSAQGESSAARYARILRYSGFTGPSNIGSGMTTSMGPANDIGGMDAMSALNEVAATENGEHFVSGDGTIVFRGRNVRYNSVTPALTFGDGPGELPFEDLQLDFDSTHLSNVVDVQQSPTGAVFTATDPASMAAYFTRPMSRSLNTTDPLECQDAAHYLVGRYSQPLTRVQSIKLHPSANPALWPSLLALELGTRVRINRRPPGAPMVTVDCFVEQIQWDMDGTGDAFVTLQCSPVDPTLYATFGALHTSLNIATLVGDSVISLKVAGNADANSPLASQLAVGTQIIVGFGTANAETATVKTVGVPATPWSSTSVTLAAPLTKSHAINDVVCEVLPAGSTDPAYWDQFEQFGKVVFAY